MSQWPNLYVYRPFRVCCLQKNIKLLLNRLWWWDTASPTLQYPMGKNTKMIFSQEIYIYFSFIVYGYSVYGTAVVDQYFIREALVDCVIVCSVSVCGEAVVAQYFIKETSVSMAWQRSTKISSKEQPSSTVPSFVVWVAMARQVDQHFVKEAALVDCVSEYDVQCSLCVSDEAILVHNIINITECVASSVPTIDLSVRVCFQCICHSSVGVQLCWRVLYIISLILSVYWCKICNWVKWLFLCIVFSKCERGILRSTRK